MFGQQEALAITKETEQVARYMQDKFQNLRVSGDGTDIRSPTEWSLEYLIEVDLAANIIWRSFQNQSSTKWDVRRYSDRVGPFNRGRADTEAEKVLTKRYPPIHDPPKLEMHPGICTDRAGNIIVWYLPGIVTPERSKSLFESIGILGALLKKGISDKSWRTSPEYHLPGKLQPGTLSLSPAWFEQAHDSSEHLLKVSAEMRSNGAAVEWLKSTRDFTALAGGILSIIQPELYQIGRAALETLYENPELVESPEDLLQALKIWYSPFSAISVISNRLTPLHRDMQGRPEWYDMLVALGEYEHGRISLPGLGLIYRYNPGTIIAFSGKIFQHGATCPGDRACLAYYMRDNVLERVAAPMISWPNVRLYGDRVGDEVAGAV